MNKTRVMVVFFIVSLAASCDEKSVTKGAWAEYKAQIAFVGNTPPELETIDPFTEATDISSIAGRVTCGYMALNESYIALEDYEGDDDATFTLIATIESGSESATFFEWSSNLKASKTQVPLSTLEPNPDAVDLIKNVLGVKKTSYSVSFKLTSNSGEFKRATALFVQKLRVATSDGSCP